MEKISILLGEVDLEAVTREEPVLSGDTTDKSVEKGADMSDHFKSNPTTIQLSGSVVGSDAASKLATLRRYFRDAELLRYSGRNIFDNMIIVSMPTRHNANNRAGFDFDINLKQVRISKPKTFEVKVANPITKQQDKKTATKVKSTTNKGNQQPKQKPIPIAPRAMSPTSSVLKDPFSMVKPGGTMQVIRDTMKVYKPSKKELYSDGVF